MSVKDMLDWAKIALKNTHINPPFLGIPSVEEIRDAKEQKEQDQCPVSLIIRKKRNPWRHDESGIFWSFKVEFQFENISDRDLEGIRWIPDYDEEFFPHLPIKPKNAIFINNGETFGVNLFLAGTTVVRSIDTREMLEEAFKPTETFRLDITVRSPEKTLIEKTLCPDLALPASEDILYDSCLPNEGL